MVIFIMFKNLGVIVNKMKSNFKVLFEFLKGVMLCRWVDVDWIYFLINIWYLVLINIVNKYIYVRIYIFVEYINVKKKIIKKLFI